MYGPGNFGVTAWSVEQARSMLKLLLENMPYLAGLSSDLDKVNFIEDIDVRLLDQGHVTPNMGAVTFLGIWYPKLNM